MVGQVIWAARRLLTGKRKSQAKEQHYAEFKARVARIEAVLARASQEWEGYFAAGESEGADPIARSYHVYVREMMEHLQKTRRHPDYARALKALDPFQQEVVRLRLAAGLPRSEPRDTSSEPPASPELAAANAAAAEARAEVDRTSRLPNPDVTTEDLKSPSYERRCHYGWAAHVLDESEFEEFFRDVWKRFPPMSPQGKNARDAFCAVRSLRRFPRLELALERYPDLPFSYDPPTPEDLLRAEWNNSEPLLRDSDPMEKIEAVFADFSADDLHEVSHGQDLYSAPFILAIARHPRCDWASALEILHSYCASSHQRYWAEGQSEAEFGKNDRMIFEAFEIISQRAKGIGFRSRSFKTNYEFGPVMTDGKPDPLHPQNWLKWAIPERKMIHPKNKRHKPSIVFDATLIRPRFEVWRQDRGL